MSDFYSDFPAIEPSEWMDKVVKDLKGKKTEDALHYKHPIEGVEYKAYAFSDGPNDDHGTPDTPPYLRGTDTFNNDWVINVSIPAGDAEAINKAALHHLMNGATGLRIDLGELDPSSCERAFKGIQFEYITATIIYHSLAQAEWLSTFFTSNAGDITFEGEHHVNAKGARNICIHGSEVQTAGGNVVQEIAWSLYKGHESLHTLLANGKSLKEALQEIKFRFGIGGNYFFEIAKFRAFRILWNDIVQAYNKNDENVGNAYIEAQTGFVNKSLNDPHTNLLRQTTEAMSAVIGGVDELTILPYNWFAKNPELSKTQRLATNIALLLKEESYMDKVIDPTGGSYSLEELTSSIADEAWRNFQSLEAGNENIFIETVKQVAKKRVELVDNKDFTHIGVNKYFNDEEPTDTWGNLPRTVFGEALILEQSVKIEA